MTDLRRGKILTGRCQKGVEKPLITRKFLTGEGEEEDENVDNSLSSTESSTGRQTPRIMECGIGEELLPELTGPNHNNFLSKDFFL